jgi:two-component system, OmpR family, sensor histidine kinase KdpD
MYPVSSNDGATEASVHPDSCMSTTSSVVRTRWSDWLRFLVECSLIAWVIALLTFCFFVLRLDLSTAGFLYLLTVVVVAQTCGLRQATLASILGVGCLDYFIVPPIFSFEFGSTRNLVALATFLFCALIVSRLSAGEKRHALESRRRRKSMERLYSVSRETLKLDLRQPPGPQLAKLIQEKFQLESAAIYDEGLGRADGSGPWSDREREHARVAFIEGIERDEPGPDPSILTSLRLLRADHRLTGALYLRGALDPLAADALASLTSVVLERCRSFDKESQAEAARQSEQMRTAVLDALAHAFKTPLTAIRTASAGLLEIGGLRPAQLDLAALVDEQADELNGLATRLLQTARLDTAALSVQPQQIIVSGLIKEVLGDQHRKLDEHPIEVSIPDRSLATQGDRGLLATIVSQFVDNAAKYSLPGTTIRVAAEGHHSQVVISVHNEGAPIRIEDRERIFERFYRCPETRDVAPGTGIGLSIARKAAEAHHGHVWVISREGEGNTFFVSLPQSGPPAALGSIPAEPAPEPAVLPRRTN